MSKRVRDSADIQSEIDHVTRQIDDADAQVRKAEDAVQSATSARDEAQAKVDETAEQLKCPDISEQERSALVAELQMRKARLITAQKDLERLSKREEQLREEELQLREEKLQLHKRELQLREEKLQLLKEEEQLNGEVLGGEERGSARVRRRMGHETTVRTGGESGWMASVRAPLCYVMIAPVPYGGVQGGLIWASGWHGIWTAPPPSPALHPPTTTTTRLTTTCLSG